jgi:hypothetical protein
VPKYDITPEEFQAGLQDTSPRILGLPNQTSAELEVEEPSFEFKKSPIKLKQKALPPPDASLRRREETVGEYRKRIARQASTEAMASGPRAQRIQQRARIRQDLTLDPRKSPFSLEVEQPRIVDAGPKPAAGEDLPSFERRRALDQRAAQLEREAQVGFPSREAKPSVTEKLRQGALKLSEAEFSEGLYNLGEALLDPLATGAGEPLRSSAVALKALGLDVAQGQAPFDYLQPRESVVEGLGADLLQALGSSGTFAAASALGGTPVVAGLGALSNAGQTYEEALRAGYNENQALVSALPAALIGSLEAFGGIGAGIERIAKGTVLRGALEEFGQESLTQLLNNVNARIVSGYDPNRAISEGVIESGLLGLVIGGSVPAGFRLPGAVRDAIASPLAERAKAFMRDETGSLKVLPDKLAPWYYSKLEREVEQKFPAKMAPQQALAMLTNPQRGIGKAELEYSGLQEMIEEKQRLNEPVTKQEMLSLIQANAVQLEEIELGQAGASVMNSRIEARRAALDIARDNLRIDWERAGNTGDPMALYAEDEGAIDDPRFLERVIQIAEREDSLFYYEQSTLENKNRTQYESFKPLKGGKPGTYRELLLKLPLKVPTQEEIASAGGTSYAAERLINRSTFEAPHFGEQGRNLLAHIRFDEGQDAEGRRVLRIQEIQSDWHQQGREKGYKKGQAYEIYDLQTGEVVDTGLDEQSARETTADGDYGMRPVGGDIMSIGAVPDAPFKNTWHELALKRMLRYAAEQGFDRIVWATGKQQIDLYQEDTRQNVDKIEYVPVDQGYDKPRIVQLKDGSWAAGYGEYSPGGTGFDFYELGSGGMAIGATREDVIRKVEADLNLLGATLEEDRITPMKLVAYKNGKQVFEQRMTREDLNKYVGPTVAQKLVESGYAEGQDLSIGGQVHKLLYDEKLPQVARQLGKKFGAQYGKTAVLVDRTGGKLVDDGAGGLTMEGGAYDSKEVHYLDIPLSMKRQLLEEGQTLAYSAAPETPQLLEDRARQMGIEVALTPETRATYEDSLRQLQERMLVLDPSSPEFEAASSEWMRLSNILFESETFSSATSWAELHGMLQNKFLAQGGRMSESKTKLSALDFAERFGTPTAVGNLADYKLRRPRNPDRASYVELPQSTFKALGYDAYGLQVPFAAFADIFERIEQRLPTEEAQVAISTIELAVADAVKKGLKSVALVSSSPRPGPLIWHETFHVAQQAALDLGEAVSKNIELLHDAEWAMNHPFVQKALQTPFGRDKVAAGRTQRLAMELPAYIAGGQLYAFEGLSSAEAVDFMLDYLTHVAEKNGLDALDRLGQVALMREGTAEMFNFAKEDILKKYGIIDEPTTSTVPGGNLRSPTPGPGPTRSSINLGPGIREVSEGGIARSEAPGEPPTPDRAFDFSERLRSQGSDPGREYFRDELTQLLGITPDTFEAALAAGAIEATGEGTFAVMEAPPSSTPEPGGLGQDPPKPPLNPSMPEEDSLYEDIVSTTFLREGIEDFKQLLREGGFEYNPKIPPGAQLYVAMQKSPSMFPRIEAVLNQRGIKLEQFVDDVNEAFSTSGRNLQLLSQTDAEWGRIFEGTNPEEIFRTKPAKAVINAAIKDFERGRTGKGLNKRMADRMRRAALGNIAITATNVITTLGQLPVRMSSNALGAAMQSLKTGEGSITGRLTEAREDALTSIQGGIEVLLAMKPKALKELLKKQTYVTERIQDTLDEIKTLYPDAYAKLTGPKSAIEETKQSKVFLDLMQAALVRIKDEKERASLSKKIKRLQTRYDRDQRLAGRLMQKADWAYELPLRPSTFQEFFFRGNYFVGELQAQLARRGQDLTVLQTLKGNKKLQAELKPLINDAMDEALALTYAYNPKMGAKGEDKGWVAESEAVVERSAAKIISVINDLGTFGFLLEGFPKAVFNGLKFAHEYGPLGLIRPLAQLTTAEGRAEFDHKDYRRLGQGFVGLMLYGAAAGLRATLGGEEWWQIKTGRRRKDGTPIYLDIRRYQPFASFVWVADIAERAATGRLGDKKIGEELAEQYLSMRRAGTEGIGLLTEFFNFLGKSFTGSETDAKQQQLEQAIGRQLALPLNPLVNLRDLWAEFSSTERLRRDPREAGIWGPSLDRIPWVRTKLLPEAVSLTSPTPVNISENPLLAQLGARFTAGDNFASREWRRMGLLPNRFLQSDRDPTIDRAQKAAFQRLISQVGNEFERDPAYQSASDAQRAAIWEEIILGPDGIASLAREAGEAANPVETERRQRLEGIRPLERKMIEEQSPGAFK